MFWDVVVKADELLLLIFLVVWLLERLLSGVRRG